MSDEKMLEEFEKWAVSEGYARDCLISGHYIHAITSAAWQAWQASRAELVIELPSSESMQACPSTSSAFDAAYSVAVKHCRAAIEAAGVRVKP